MKKTKASFLILLHGIMFMEGFSLVAPTNRRYISKLNILQPMLLSNKSLERTMQNEKRIMMSSEQNYNSSSNEDKRGKSLASLSKQFCKLSPLWTFISAAVALKYSSIVEGTIGSISIMQKALTILMLAMGLTITPQDISKAIQKPYVVGLNILLCFGMMPVLSMLISFILGLDQAQSAGLILLGCVSGGQASNLFTLLAGGDVALSVVCTLSTTLLGVLLTPLSVQLFLNCFVEVDGVGVLKSVSNLVLFPLLAGLSLGKIKPSLVKRLEPICPPIGVLATLILVAGGASNSASFLARGDSIKIILASCLLPLLGGGIAWILSYIKVNEKIKISEEASRRALVIEVLSKSPTLSYVLAIKHFGRSAAFIPAAAMISLAILGAIVATVWTAFDPIEKYDI